MSQIKMNNRLRQKATVRVANKPWNSLKLTFLLGLGLGGGIGSLVMYFVR
jgi:hypothetical protein